MSKTGCKGKYCPEIIEEICQYLREGDSDRLAYTKAGISCDSFYDWQNLHPEFFEAVKAAKADFKAKIVRELEVSLFKRAKGYEITETEVEMIPDREGNPVIKKQKTKKKQIAADTTAMVFALCNVAPEKWKNVQRVETKEIDPAEKTSTQYHFEDLPKELINEVTDRLQEAEYRRNKEEKGGR